MQFLHLLFGLLGTEMSPKTELLTLTEWNGYHGSFFTSFILVTVR